MYVSRMYLEAKCTFDRCTGPFAGGCETYSARSKLSTSAAVTSFPRQAAG